MSGYVIAGYLVTLGTLGAYATRTILRSRALRTYLKGRDAK